jgi:hypothetical protein
MTSNIRYQGKPLLRLLECYVLLAIGQLGQKEVGALQAMTPKLQSIYHVTGDWQDEIAAAAHLPQDMPEMIRAFWDKNVQAAKASAITLDPQRFAKMSVDQNLAF